MDREGGVVTRQVAGLPFLGELVDGGGQGDDVVSSAVGPGVARPEHPGQHLASLGQHRRERMVSVGALVRRGGVLFVGPGAHDRGVQIDDRFVSVGPGAGLPRGGPGRGSGTSETAQLSWSQRVEGPLHVRPGRHRPEQVRLAPESIQVR